MLIKEALEQAQYFSSLAQLVPCTCGQCFDPDNNDTGIIQTYECKQCDRVVPWCYGCDDEYFELCDACAVRLAHKEGAWDNSEVTV
ncbi:hypothetical protein V2H45_09475 [Tumidithrix elongata RA019]|uniref:ZZ-type domain-containing protein n=1 Tax=Tumidithrix elongata BACA0141 TaxID=2716417 RepID=A0AAW9PYJ2_9CYAN|nr:hypothetical protein [Tumidithrix elongata RA019]